MPPKVILTGKIHLPVPETPLTGSSSITNGVTGFCFANNQAHAGVYGEGSATAAGVWGLSDKGDGVHGQSNGDDMSAVAGVHIGSGHGVYGHSARGDAGFFDGNVTVTGNLTVSGDILLVGADCAERFASPSAGMLEPGTVVVIGDEGSLHASRAAYDKKVAGVVAGAGSYRPGIVLDAGCAKDSVTVAMVGKTFCKVDAEYGSIAIGDLLTSSPTEGHAMCASDGPSAFGAVIGKAMASLPSGKGMIPILVTLH